MVAEKLIVGLDIPWCQTSDMDRSVAFYRDILGIEPAQVSPYWSSFELGNTRFALHPNGKSWQKPEGFQFQGWVLGLQTPNVKALREKLETNGVSIENDQYYEVPGGVLITFADPDGNIIQAVQRGVRLKDVQP